MDEIGLIATFVDKKGFMRFGRLGGVRPLSVLGQRVRFGNGILGVIGAEKGASGPALPSWEEMPTGVARGRMAAMGDAACFDEPLVVQGNRLIAKAMDDRIGCALGVQALLELGETPNDVYFVFTVQEEVGIRGATVSAFGVEPEVALALDVTLVGDTPEASPWPSH